MWLNAGLQRIRAPNPVFIRCYITFMTMIGSGFTKQGRTPHLFGTEQQRDKKKKKKERNDRLIAIQEDAHSWADIKTIDDLGKELCRELEDFFVNYHELSGKEYRVLGVKGPTQAHKLVKSGMNGR